MQANIVEEMNKVLSDTYCTECYLMELNTKVAFEPFCGSGMYSSEIKFFSGKEIAEFECGRRKDGCVLVQCAMDVDGWHYTGILLYGSKLHRKLLKAQLKHIPKEI